MEKVPYNIGLDIGTSSIGFAATDNLNKPIRAKGKTVIGVRLFEEGKTAADRRGFRTTRRRLSRRKWRLRLLDEIFDKEMAKVDNTFFARLKESNLSPKDANKKYLGSLLFPEKKDFKFYEDYPTIYHLRYALMHEKRQFDIREVYLAMHHIIKYRGNFLNSAPMNSFKTQDFDFVAKFEKLNELFESIDAEHETKFDIENISKFRDIMLNQDIRKLDRKKQAAKILILDSTDKTAKKINNKIATAVANSALGYKFALDAILKLDVEESKDWSISLNDEEIDSILDNLTSDLDAERIEIIEILRDLYSHIALNEIVPNGQSLSKSMMDKYDKHHADLDVLKKVISNMDDRKKAKSLKNIYNQYVGKTNDKVLDKDEFYKQIQKNLDESEDAMKIVNEIELDQFMPKQRTSQNGVIPHQLHQKELDEIIENQKQYYPFLAEPNPNEKRKPHAQFKLDELIAFKIPYYVGPLITKEEQQAQSGAKFAWMKRKQDGVITPWNFDEKVDRMASANEFIRRMTTKDTYLLGEDVLPDESLIYQKFKVLNELNNVKVNDKKLTVSDKQDIFNDLFKKQKTVSVSKLQKYFVTEKHYLTEPTIKGLSDTKKFSNSLSTYIDFEKIFGNEILADQNKQNDLEKIIEWSTIFEDRKIFEDKLHEIEWLTEKQIKAVRRYRGWGRLSKKLLVDLRNNEGKSILDELWRTNDNFMQIQAREEFAKSIVEANQKLMNLGGAASVQNTVESTLEDAYTSPQNKKAIRQVIKVVEDIVKAVGYAPEKITIEFTRGADKNPRRTQNRQKQIMEVYKTAAKEIVDATLKGQLENEEKLTDKLYLYFIQLGKDIYSGETINIDQLNNYDIDHILPQAFIKDDSLDNRVLTSRDLNNGKSDSVPVKQFGANMKSFWMRLQAHGLISKRKLNNLMTDPDSIGKYTMQGFVRRQLVETSQVIKLTANILGAIYGENTDIVEIPAKLTHQMREKFNLYKVREVNDYHHAFDAYLTTFVGNYLFKRYPKLRPYFVYGDFKMTDNALKGMRRFNFLHDLKDDEVLVDNETGEVLWEGQKSIEELKKIYGYKFMLTTHEAYTQHGPMFKQTVYSSDTPGKLIKIKNNKPTEIYGGYTSNTDAYMAIVRIKARKGDTYKVVGVPRKEGDALSRIKLLDESKYHENLKNILAINLNKSLNKFDVVLDKVKYRQVIYDGTDHLMLGSSKYKYSTKQLVLSDQSMKILSSTGEFSDEELIKVFDEIMYIVNKNFSLYDTRGFRDKLNNARENFIKLPNKTLFEKGKLKQHSKLEILKQILIGLHANAGRGDLKDIGVNNFGAMVVTAGVTLSPDATIVYQSPTGLFERKVKLSDL
ncbi:type II CRISPR RNA-guided endonuclease Cas9 [Pediococcus pentosaceus]|uniref:type II CRISPR RNA-guided endonuclease Cas9 n=1 Tax=Pediococcus pentosaceus TaxID=1255 RepID=UPI00233007CC|nr:type II CRISPR RNA-guided endonuclease Cas9 [Pediococcus pentosaceus]MDB1561622.1 type II CRISPR RNA-guided endonuclease Cas9 [Pediococcus pentosaceus]